MNMTSYACVWEAAARKVGNVHPRASFANTTYLDFVQSALAIHDTMNENDIGMTVYRGVLATREIVGQNTNLGILLLLAPLNQLPEQTMSAVLSALTVRDAELVYDAIQAAQPAGLGSVAEQDVKHYPSVTLLDAMKLAADRDLIARQYANNYADVFELGVPALLKGFNVYGCVEAAIIHCQFAWMAAFSDSLIARKNGLAVAENVQKRMQEVIALGGLATAEGRAAGVALDAHLRSDGNKLNPGTTADLVSACLFVALREGTLKLNAPFAWKVEDWL